MVGSSVQHQLSATGGSGDYTYHVSGQLPLGMTLSTEGRIEGQAVQTGTYTFTITVTDSNGQTASFTYTLTVEPMRIFVPIITRQSSSQPSPSPRTDLRIFIPIVVRTTP